jgi:hypothetical protein
MEAAMISNNRSDAHEIEPRLEVYTKEEFDKLSGKFGFKAVFPDKEVDLNLLLDDRIKNNYTRLFESSKKFKLTAPTKSKKDLVNPPFNLEKFEFVEPLFIEDKKPESTAPQPLIAYIIGSALGYAASKTKSLWRQSYIDRINSNVDRLHKSLYKATDLNIPASQRAQHWKNASRTMEQLNKRMSNAPKGRTERALNMKSKLSKALYSHLYMGGKSVNGKLNTYWSTNKAAFNPSDNKAFDSFSKKMKESGQKLKSIIANLKKLLTNLFPSRKPKV